MNIQFSKIFNFLYGALFFLTPLAMYSRTSELFEFNKILIIYLITGLIFAGWTSRMILSRRIILRWHPLLFVFMAILSVHIISTVTSIDVWTSIFGYYGRFNGGLLSIIAYVVLLVAFISNITTQSKESSIRTIESLLSISMVSAFLVFLWGLPSRFGYDLSCFLFTGNLDVACWTDQFKPTVRLFSTIGQPNWMAIYTVIHIFIATYFYLKEKVKLKAFLYAGFILFAMVMLLFTRSRSGVLALIVGGLIMDTYFFINRKELFKQYKHKLITLSAVIIIPVMVLGSGISQLDKFIYLPQLVEQTQQSEEAKDLQKNEQPDEVVDRDIDNGDIVNITDSGSIRRIVWQGAFGLGLEHPIVGTGVETFAYSYNFVRPLQHNATSEWDYVYNKAHNELFNYLATTGFVGAFVYLLMTALVLFYVKYAFDSKIEREKQLLILSLVSAYAGIFVSNFLGFSTTTNSLFTYLIPGMLIIIVHGSSLKKFSESETITADDSLKMLVPALCALVTVWFVIQYFRADKAYALGDNLRSQQEYQQSLVHLYDAYAIRNEHIYADKISQVIAQQGLILAFTGSENIDCLDINGSSASCIQLAQHFGDKSLEKSPFNPYYYRTKARNNFLFFQITQDPQYIDIALDSARTAMELAPTDPRYPYLKALIALGLYESIQNPTDEDRRALENVGLASIQLAVKMKEDYIEGQYLKGLILKNLGDIDQAKQTFEYILSVQPDNEQVKKELEDL